MPCPSSTPATPWCAMAPSTAQAHHARRMFAVHAHAGRFPRRSVCLHVSSVPWCSSLLTWPQLEHILIGSDDVDMVAAIMSIADTLMAVGQAKNALAHYRSALAMWVRLACGAIRLI